MMVAEPLLCCVVPAALVAGAGALVPDVEGEPELPHAASRAAPPATTGAAHHRLRMARAPFLVVSLKALLSPIT
jgi:hypothetical protein